jgi:uncharacterized membrane protein YfcA
MPGLGLETLDAALIARLLGTGLVAGALNTLAGGGSLLLVPALMLTGMTATLANATSRVAVLAQCLASVLGFARRDLLPTAAARPIVPPVVAGAAIGAVIASRMPDRVYEPLLLATLTVMAVAMLVSPARFMPPPGAEPRSPTGPWAIAGLFLAGIYGGVLQAGAGLVFIAILAGGLRYDLVRANALKALVMLIYIAGTVVVFAGHDRIVWGPALVLAAGAALGGWLASQLALSKRGLAITNYVVVIAAVGLALAVALR